MSDSGEYAGTSITVVNYQPSLVEEVDLWLVDV